MQYSHYPLDVEAELADAVPRCTEEEDTPLFPQLHVEYHQRDPGYQTCFQSSASASYWDITYEESAGMLPSPL